MPTSNAAWGMMVADNSKERTFGGLPAETALNWNSETYQAMGRIVHLLMSGNPEKAYQGYLSFYQMKRQFMENEFNRVFDALESSRRERKYKTVTEMLECVGGQLIKNKRVCSIEPSHNEIPQIDFGIEISPTVEPRSYGDRVEQMSLF